MRFAVAFLAGFVALTPVVAKAAQAQDSGRITNLYIAGDSVAFHLDGGFPNAVASNICPSANQYWAGKQVMEKSLASALLSAKLTGSRVTVTLTGCDGNGAWFKASEVYISD